MEYMMMTKSILFEDNMLVGISEEYRFRDSYSITIDTGHILQCGENSYIIEIEDEIATLTEFLWRIANILKISDISQAVFNNNCIKATLTKMHLQHMIFPSYKGSIIVTLNCVHITDQILDITFIIDELPSVFDLTEYLLQHQVSIATETSSLQGYIDGIISIHTESLS